MVDRKITILIGKAIREGKYLSITYKNKYGEVTPFWISIFDINEKDELIVNMSNVTKEEPIKNAKIFISSILTAEILKFSRYDVPDKLIQKLDNDESLEIYEFNRFDNKILNYYHECYKANKDPFLYKAHLIPGLDLSILITKNPYQLSNEQQNQIIKEIYHNDYNKFYNYELAISEFSIDLPTKGKFIVAFKKISLDPVNKTLHIDNKTQFNAHFYLQDVKHTLSYYTDLAPNDFEEIYLNNKQEAIEILNTNFRTGELTNTRPELVVLGYSQIEISKIYENIQTAFQENDIDAPLKALFQNLSLLDRKNRTEPNIVLYDHNINIDQIQTIYNALKFPITYVQGPPGTGKTQTILNIIVNCLTNNKSLLITSNNNIPIDGIKNKLNLGKYRNKDILLPVLRLGNKKYIEEALQTIKSRFSFETKDVPKEELLFNLKEQSKAKNRQLLENIKNHEIKIEQTQNLQFVKDLLKKGENYLLEKEKVSIEDKLKQIPEIQIENWENLFEVIKDNHQLLQFFYFESLKYVKRLKNKEYSSLIEILNLEPTNKQVSEFNKWIAADENLEKLTKIFPIILTTNLSSRKLGQKHKFNLLVMDEAGQCDIATSLIPISKCKNMVLIGDTNQLKPIVVFEERRNNNLMKQYEIETIYDYFNNSILSVYKNIDNISRNILLSYHYRCGKNIINYSNMRFYENKLNLTKINYNGEVNFIDVNNLNQKSRNSNIEETQEIVNYISENNLKDVFIITPFRNQQETLNRFLEKAKEEKKIDESVSCGTIHKIQGQENKTIIISTSISRNTTSKTYDWIKNNSELINVGVTRAQENLIVVADKRAIDILSRKDDDLYALIEYAQQKGTLQINKSAVNKFTIGFSNDSKFEDEFYKTMSHYCTIQGTRFERNVKIIDLFPEEKDNTLVNKKEFDGVIFKGSSPEIVFEVNGIEHLKNSSRMKSDHVKMQLLNSKNIQLLLITNQYVKHYEYIRELMNKIKGKPYQKTLFEESEPNS